MRRNSLIICFLLCSVIVFSSCSESRRVETNLINSEHTETTNISTNSSKEEFSDYKLIDNLKIYENSDPSSIVYFYVTVRKGNQVDLTNNEFSEVNSVVKRFATYNEPVRSECIIQEGDENGPKEGMLGYNEVLPNGTIEVRGLTSTGYRLQKSYKLYLNNGDIWRGQKSIALNKHIYDRTRVRNKLAFDLMIGLPSFVGLRTQFVHLYIKDETKENPDTQFVFYGLYTQVENPNTSFLRNHRLDENAHLYKAINFTFEPRVDALKLISDEEYDDKKFNNVLLPKGNTDHTKILALIDKVNDYTIGIDTILDENFDIDNYTTWMAFNLLIGNEDTLNQNFFLYSPLNCEKWFIIPWDYDGSLTIISPEQKDKDNNKYGVTIYWHSVLHQRALKSEKFRASLDEKIQLLRTIVTKERITEMLKIYHPIAEEALSTLPDSSTTYYELSPLEDCNNEIADMPNMIEINYRRYKESLENLMGFYMGLPVWDSAKKVYKFNWSSSYILNDEIVYYRLTIARDEYMKEIVIEKDGIILPGTSVTGLEPGKYFYKVVSYTKSGKAQISNESYRNGWVYHWGIVGITIDAEHNVKLLK